MIKIVTLYFFIFLTIALQCADCEVLKTKDGQVFHNYKITKRSAEGIEILHSKGFSWLLISNLPDDLAEKYSPDLKTSYGVYRNYSVLRISHKSIKIKHTAFIGT